MRVGKTRTRTRKKEGGGGRQEATATSISRWGLITPSPPSSTHLSPPSPVTRYFCCREASKAKAPPRLPSLVNAFFFWERWEEKAAGIFEGTLTFRSIIHFHQHFYMHIYGKEKVETAVKLMRKKCNVKSGPQNPFNLCCLLLLISWELIKQHPPALALTVIYRYEHAVKR